MLGMAAAFGYAFTQGNPSLAKTSWDYDKMGCGVNTTTKDYPVLYWPEIPGSSAVSEVSAGNFSSVVKLLKSGVCVKECPTGNSTIDCSPTTWMTSIHKNYYSGCKYYPAGVSTGVTFQYPTF